MATEVRETRNNTGLWVVLGIIALLAIIVIAWMATAGTNNDIAETEPATVVTNMGDTGRSAADSAADSAAAAAQSAQNAAERAADAAGETARNAGEAASDAAGRITATIPAGDADIRVDAPVR